MAPFDVTPLAAHFLKTVDLPAVIAGDRSDTGVHTIKAAGSGKLCVSTYDLVRDKNEELCAALLATGELSTPYVHCRVWGTDKACVVTVSDDTQQTGQSYLCRYIGKPRLDIQKIKRLDVPIAALTFLTHNHPVWPSTTKPIELQTIEFILGTADGSIYFAAANKKDVTIESLSTLVFTDQEQLLRIDVLVITKNMLKKCMQLGMQALDGHPGPDSDITKALSSVSDLCIYLFFFCLSNRVEIYCQLATGMTLLPFTTDNLIHVADLAESLQTAPPDVLTVCSRLYYDSFGVGLSYQAVGQAYSTGHYSVMEISLCPRRIIESILHFCGSKFKKSSVPLAQDDAEYNYEGLAHLLKNVSASDLVRMKLKGEDVMGIQLKRSTLFQDPVGPLLGTFVFNYNTILVFSSQLVAYNNVSGTIIDRLVNPLKYRSLISLTTEQVYLRLLLSQTMFTLNYATIDDMFPTIESSGAVNLSHYLRKYALIPSKQTKDTEAYLVEAKNEAESMWIINRELGKYEEALRLCPDPNERALLRREYAVDCLSKGKNLRAAQVLAETSLPFTDVYRELIGAQKYEVAERFIMEKLRLLAAKKPPPRVPVATFDLDTLGAMNSSSFQRDQQAYEQYKAGVQLAYHLRLEAMVLEYKRRSDAVQSAQAAGDELHTMELEDSLALYRNVLEDFLFAPTTHAQLKPAIVKATLEDRGLTDLYQRYLGKLGDKQMALLRSLQDKNYRLALQLISELSFEHVYQYAGLMFHTLPEEFFEVIKRKVQTPVHERGKVITFNIMELALPMLSEITQGNKKALDAGCKFMKWLLQTQAENQIAPVNTFAFEFLCRYADESAVEELLEDIPENYCGKTQPHINLHDLLAIFRTYHLRGAEATCLAKLGKTVDAICLEFKLLPKAELCDVSFGTFKDAIVEAAAKDDKDLSSLPMLNAEEFVLPDSHEVLLNEAILVIDNARLEEQKRQVIRGLGEWLLSIILVDSMGMAKEFSGNMPVIQTAFRRFLVVRACSLLMSYSFVTLSEIIDLLGPDLPPTIAMDGLLQAMTHYGEVANATYHDWEATVARIEENRSTLECSSQRLVTFTQEPNCGICNAPISGATKSKLIRNNVIIFFCGHVFHGGCLFTYLADRSRKLKKSYQDLEALRQAVEAGTQPKQRYTTAISRICTRLQEKCPLCTAAGLDDLATDICTGKPLFD
ncbi:hypothetical protein GMRT_13001 [Giardia muris]|uniref:RING-type domain-containing protein n=1 Tax=Giardia muris TaxID=5742 RepID=A0A4Z1SWW9_GIAMU|nr:hypothetical protein GMRT_13001 [Giardia muris]|eukprot:TNJ30302.1 hypothetical protein GMRT_13001 [Giardia muris]